VQIVQTAQSFEMGSTVADAEAWGETCDIPLVEPLDPVRGSVLMASQTLCGHTSRPSAPESIGALHAALPAPQIAGPLFECARMVRVTDIHPGARVEIYMTCDQPPRVRMIAGRYVFEAVADLLVAPALALNRKVFVRQLACLPQADSNAEPVHPLGHLGLPGIKDCGKFLHVTGVVPGALVEVYRDGSFFASARSGGSEVLIPLITPLPTGAIVKARQLLCDRVSFFGDELTIRHDVVKQRLTWVSTNRICQLTGLKDPEGKPIHNNCVDAHVIGTDLGIVIDHDTGDGLLYFFFGDTQVFPVLRFGFPLGLFPDCGKVMARTSAHDAGLLGPPITFLHHTLPVPLPFVFDIEGVGQGCLEVPSGGFSHAGKLYVFATTDRFTAKPFTEGIKNDADFMGRSVLASSADWHDTFQVVPGHESISDHARSFLDESAYVERGEFKFINIAPWKIRNDDWPHLPPNAVPGGEGLILVGSGRYRESQACLAYVPLPPNADPRFEDWRFLSGFGAVTPTSGPCGTPKWSTHQRDAIFLFDDREFFPGKNGVITVVNRGVVGELSLAYIREVGCWVLLYAGVVLRWASHPWGPWSDPIRLFDFARDHAKHDEPGDQRPRFIKPGGGMYGPYVVPRFTRFDHLTHELTLYYTMSTWNPYQVMLMKSVLRFQCVYEPHFLCASSG